ncbi:prion-inhibition and propagation-domain-containing protein [Annulohypoxylon maeteangense]|uniref:prion-inhibition and propagation-domain-containing protein n=1 Tax=Annulohypoxylon maeteangense TaxID=1927788 RepID=UPI0020071DFB|nr:prion-inhibition and propagation-domain-containing protein [Annulohypoxylon maeteangense]KAI0880959.1 prion-inhibition and propagation-domain-containing protein [Annulohypoxylon maeteangense]
MDPGTALGVVSLAFQVFSGCIKGCQLLLDAKNLPKKYGYLRHRLRLEQLKLLDWWDASGFVTEAAFQDSPLDERKQAMVESLLQIKSITFDIGRIKERYDLSLKVSDESLGNEAPTSGNFLELDSSGTSDNRETLRQKALKYADTVLKCPIGLRWAVFDAAKFEQLLARFSELNNSMHFSLELGQRLHHIELQERSHMQILQVHEKLDQVVELVRSLHLLPHCNSGASSQGSDEGVHSTLERLARFKALSMTVGLQDLPCEEDTIVQIGLEVPSPGDLELLLSQVELYEDQKQLGIHRVMGKYGGTPIWVEWKGYDKSSTTLAYRCVETRIIRLAALLLKNPDTPRKLRLPTSLGYIHDPSSARFGIVFELPALTSTSIPLSLYDRFQISLKPSLTVRLDMARKLTVSLEYIHAMKWLHKGLRSDDILFLQSSGFDWLSFCICGFEYSRPANPNEVTELPSDNREHDLYRHPDVQFDVPRDGEYGYKEKHDIYSLGVILTEIGLWQPIHQVLGISLNRFIRRPIIREARSNLLKPESIAILESETGERYTDAVILCLTGSPRDPFEKQKGFAFSEEKLKENSTGCLKRTREILQNIKL